MDCVETNIIIHKTNEENAQCRLCGECSTPCSEISTLSPFITASFIDKHMGIKLKSNGPGLPNLLLVCANCINSIKSWHNFVQQCQNAQPFIKER